MPETAIVCFVSHREQKLATGKIVWKFKDDNNNYFQCWDKKISEYIMANEECEIKYSTKTDGQYTNRTINAVKDSASGEWINAAPPPKAAVKGASGPGVPVDPIPLVKSACIQAAAQLVAASASKETSEPLGILEQRTIKAAFSLEAGYFADIVKKPKGVAKVAEKEQETADATA